MIGVNTALGSYRTAAGELPASLRFAAEAGEIVVIADDAEGLRIGQRAADGTARVIVVDRPDPASGTVRTLAATGVAVVLNRPALRADDARDAAPPTAAAAASVHAHVARGTLRGALADAVGWGRVLAGSPLALRAAWSDAADPARAADGADGGAVLADLATSDGTGVALVVSERRGTRGQGRLRATTIAPERVDVVWADGVTQVTRSTRAGALVVPRRWESSERLALRRALALLGEGALDEARAVDDVERWHHDLALADSILVAR